MSGRRNTIKYADAPVATVKRRRTLPVGFRGTWIKVGLNGKPYIDLQDPHITDSGAVGMRTRTDSVDVFDDFAYGALHPSK